MPTSTPDTPIDAIRDAMHADIAQARRALANRPPATPGVLLTGALETAHQALVSLVAAVDLIGLEPSIDPVLLRAIHAMKSAPAANLAIPFLFHNEPDAIPPAWFDGTDLEDYQTNLDRNIAAERDMEYEDYVAHKCAMERAEHQVLLVRCRHSGCASTSRRHAWSSDDFPALKLKAEQETWYCDEHIEPVFDTEGRLSDRLVTLLLRLQVSPDPIPRTKLDVEYFEYKFAMKRGLITETPKLRPSGKTQSYLATLSGTGEAALRRLVPPIVVTLLKDSRQ